MLQANPRPYENMLYVDYPAKNGKRVDALARRIVTSDTVKKTIADEVKKETQPTVDEKIANLDPRVQKATRLMLDKTIDKVVEKALDKVVFDKKPVNIDERE